MGWPRFVLDKFLAPGVTAFTSAQIPDMSTKRSAWWEKYFLNNVLRATYQGRTRVYVFNALRRTYAAFTVHDLARRETEAFLQDREHLARYIAALFHWETFLAQSWQAYALLRKLIGVDLFQKNDGSTQCRLNALYNLSKHADSAIDNDQLPPEATVPVWLSNDGLRSIDSTLSWSETGEVLDDLAKFAHILEDPLSAKERLQSS